MHHRTTRKPHRARNEHHSSHDKLREDHHQAPKRSAHTHTLLYYLRMQLPETNGRAAHVWGLVLTYCCTNPKQLPRGSRAHIVGRRKMPWINKELQNIDKMSVRAGNIILRMLISSKAWRRHHHPRGRPQQHDRPSPPLEPAALPRTSLLVRFREAVTPTGASVHSRDGGARSRCASATCGYRHRWGFPPSSRRWA